MPPTSLVIFDPSPSSSISQNYLDTYLSLLRHLPCRMPHLSPQAKRVVNRLLSQQLDAQATRLEERYQDLSQQFRAAQLQFHTVRTHYRSVQQECAWLQQVVCTKQQVIEELLPYYPHPLTPELLYAIELY